MVAEVIAPVEADEQAPLETPGSDDTPQSLSAVPEIEGKGEIAAVEGEAPQAEPSDAEQLQSALDAIAKFDRGEAETLSLTTKQRGLVQSHQDRQASQEQAHKLAQDHYEALVKELDTSHQTAHSNIVARINQSFDDAGIAFTPAEAELLSRDIEAALLGPEGLRGKAEQSIITPLQAAVQRDLAKSLVDNDGLTEREAWTKVQSLSLVQVPGEAFRLGLRAGRKQGPAEGSKVYTDKEIEKLKTDAREEVATIAKNQGVTLSAISGGSAKGVSSGTPTYAQIQKMSPAELEALDGDVFMKALEE